MVGIKLVLISALLLAACAKDSSKKDEPLPASTGQETPIAPPSPVTNDNAGDETALSFRMNEMTAKGHSLYKSMINQVSGSSSGAYPICSIRGGCKWSEGIGILTLSEGACVATLIAEDVIVTAGHCLSALKIGDRLNATFALPDLRKSNLSRADGPEILQAILVLARSEETDPVDFAFLKLASGAKSHRPLKLSREGVQDQMTYSTVGEDLVEGSPTFKQWNVRNGCFSSYRNVLTRNFDHPYDRFFSLSNCPIGSGNSGAPILNKKNEVVGIVKGHINTVTYLLGHDYFLNNGFTNQTKNPFVSAATNSVCIPDVVSGLHVVPTECDSLGADVLRLSNGSSKKGDSGHVYEKLQSLDPNAKYELANGKWVFYATTYVQIPKCVDKEKVKIISGVQFIETLAYSPMINEYFEMTEVLSKPKAVRLVLKVLDGDSSKFLATLSSPVNLEPVHSTEIKKCELL